MKTSNIILLGFLGTIFIIPLLLIASLNSKIKNKEFTLIKNNYTREAPMIREGNLPSYSVVKFTSPDPDFMVCHLTSGDTSGFSYQKFDKQDSIAVFVSNDTLFVNYHSPSDSIGKKIRLGNRLEINMKIKTLPTIIVDGASIFLDSLDTNEGFKVILKNNGKISDVQKEKTG